MPRALDNYKSTAECCSQASVPRGDTVPHLRYQCTQVVESFGSESSLQLGDSKTALAAAAELESALVEHVYSSPHTALGHLQAAGTALGMQTTVEGQPSLCYLTDLQCTSLTMFGVQSTATHARVNAHTWAYVSFHAFADMRSVIPCMA